MKESIRNYSKDDNNSTLSAISASAAADYPFHPDTKNLKSVKSLAEKVKFNNVLLSLSSPIADSADIEGVVEVDAALIRIDNLKANIEKHERRNQISSGLKRLKELSERTTLASFSLQNQLELKGDALSRIGSTLEHIRLLSSI